MIKALFSFTFILFFLFKFGLAQEYISYSSVNADIKEYIKNQPKTKSKTNKSKSVLELPFWDDFSYGGVYANPNLWEIYDRVYINSTLATEPPSIGFATFDAINSAGEIYEQATYETPFIADILTSDSINLDYPGDNTIYLSFYFKPQGLGEAPEKNDSLILEFYAPEEETWTTAWFALGTFNTAFQFVILHINDAKYLKPGFKFRFKNYVTLGSATTPSIVGNGDFWHIDYVYLNRNRNANDNVFRDIAFNKPLHSLLKNFEAVPWSHYKASASNLIRDKISIAYKNNDNVTRLIDSLNFTLKDQSGFSSDQKWYAGSYTPPPFKQEFFDFTGHSFTFPTNSDDFAEFKFQAKIVTDTYDSAQNNLIAYYQKFQDYYAYDDGSAEAGYGIYGAGTKYGSVAYKFTPLKSDYITGVRMYFTQTLNDASQKYFWIYLWKVDANGLPGDTIRTIEGIRPEYEGELNKFHLYKFTDKVLINGPFYIGWTQTTDDKLNVGFDYNNDNSDKLFYNIKGEWKQSEITGSAMIRPVFGDYFGGIPEIAENKIKVYPNPAQYNLFIDFEKDFSKSYTLKLYNIQGREINLIHNFNPSYIDISSLQNGIYFISLSDNESMVFNTKFIKQ